MCIRDRYQYRATSTGTGSGKKTTRFCQNGGGDRAASLRLDGLDAAGARRRAHPRPTIAAAAHRAVSQPPRRSGCGGCKRDTCGRRCKRDTSAAAAAAAVAWALRARPRPSGMGHVWPRDQVALRPRRAAARTSLLRPQLCRLRGGARGRLSAAAAGSGRSARREGRGAERRGTDVGGHRPPRHRRRHQPDRGPRRPGARCLSLCRLDSAGEHAR
eukprot:3580060-Prymnesium_polylepis.1